MKYYTSTTRFNCGIDLHARQMYVCLMDREGKKLLHTNIKNNDFEHFLKLVAPYRHDLTVCCECMFGWYWLADACQAAGLTFVYPAQMRPARALLRQRLFYVWSRSELQPQTRLHAPRGARVSALGTPGIRRIDWDLRPAATVHGEKQNRG